MSFLTCPNCVGLQHHIDGVCQGCKPDNCKPDDPGYKISKATYRFESGEKVKFVGDQVKVKLPGERLVVIPNPMGVDDRIYEIRPHTAIELIGIAHDRIANRRAKKQHDRQHGIGAEGASVSQGGNAMESRESPNPHDFKV